MIELPFFQDTDVAVTNARFTVPGQTFAIRNITSVKIERNSRRLFYPIFFALCGALVWFFCHLVAPKDDEATKRFGYYGAAFSALRVGAIIYRLRKPRFSLVLISSAGEIQAIKGDLPRITRIANALNEAIVHNSGAQV
jgi:hypothetical protein